MLEPILITPLVICLIWPFFLPIALFGVIHPIPDIYPAILIADLTLAICLVIYSFPSVIAPIAVDKPSVAICEAIFEISLVNRPVVPVFCAFPMVGTVFSLPNVNGGFGFERAEDGVFLDVFEIGIAVVGDVIEGSEGF